jgi:hypothetical protein
MGSDCVGYKQCLGNFFLFCCVRGDRLRAMGPMVPCVASFSSLNVGDETLFSKISY